MKKLNQFAKFDWESFAKDKQFICIGCREWKEMETEKHLGTRVESVIVVDNTAYITQDNEEVSNLFEKIIFKVPKDISVPINVEIRPKGVVAKVYGDYRNQLSCIAEDIIFTTKS